MGRPPLTWCSVKEVRAVLEVADVDGLYLLVLDQPGGRGGWD
jgi:hypothetical protein